jgi:transcriptional regulator with XRE-family HTH domain
LGRGHDSGDSATKGGTEDQVSKGGTEDQVKKARERRKALGVSLDELAAALGPGFSHARLSIAERGLIQLSESEQEIILAAIERIGEIRAIHREMVQSASSVDPVSICADLRQRAQALQAVS